MNKENEENSNSLLHNKRRRNQYTIPYAIKQKLTLRLMDECFTDELILISSKKANEMKKKEIASTRKMYEDIIKRKDSFIKDLLEKKSDKKEEIEEKVDIQELDDNE